MQKLLNAFNDLVEANKTVKRTFPSDWSERMNIYRLMIADAMKSQPNTLFAAVILSSQYSENENSRMWIYATAVEMIEEG